MNAWRELELGEKVAEQVEYISSSANALVTFGDVKVNLGKVSEEAVGEKVVIEKSSEQFGVCLNSEYRGDDYLETHPLTGYEFYQNVGTDSNPEYREWVRSNADPQLGELFTAKIDRIGWNDMGVVDIIGDYKILVNGVTQDDVGKLVEAKMHDNGVSTNKAEKISGDLKVIETLPSADSVESVEWIDEQEDSPEGATTDTSEEIFSSGDETVDPQNNSESQTNSSLRKEAEEDAVEQVPEETVTSEYQAAVVNRQT